MSAILKKHIDPTLLSPGDKKVLELLNKAVEDDERPHLMGREGVKIDLPDQIFQVLVQTIKMMRRGQRILLVPDGETLTTQAAADSIGVSRPFFVGLLEKGEIPFHMVGKHRRIAIRDILEYAAKRDSGRRKTLDELTDRIEGAGLYDTLE